VDDLPALTRTIHTLKGNSSIFGIHTIATLCHEMETAMVEDQSVPSEELVIELGQRWNRLKSNLETLIGARQRRSVEIEDTEYEAILAALLNGTPHEEIARRIARWKLEPTQRRLERISEQAKGIAQRLSKGDISVNIADQGLHLDASAWAPFWSSFVHVVRNAIDHGLEHPEDRSAQGKSETGSLTLRTTMDGNEFVVEILDDGRGIDWDAVKEKARENQIPCETRSEQEEALFRDGITTMTRVTEFSGRGVGMGAARAACRERGGNVRIQSTQGAGTSVQFRFPAKEMAPPSVTRPVFANSLSRAS
jgi:two-component system chemotaxis sensor kinase CheA